jgi:hypothetical protein
MERRAFLAALWTARLVCAADERDAESLRDLDGVRVAVEGLSLAVPLKGVSSDELMQAASAKLRQAGVHVFNQGEYPVGDPYLRVQVTTTKKNRGLAGYHVEVDFVQIVFMRRNPSATLNRAETWKARGRMGLVPTARLAEAIQQELSAQLDQFISAYRSVNP